MSRTSHEIQTLIERDPHACPVCAFVEPAMRTHIDSLFYERVTDIQTRAAIREAGGFCRYHARLVSDQGDALGTAIVMRDLIVNELRVLTANDARAGGLSAIGKFLSGNRSESVPVCTLCDAERDLEVMVTDTILRALAGEEPFRRAFSASDGLCIPHFCLASGRNRNSSLWKLVVDVQTRGLSTLAEELEALAISFDANKRHTVDEVDTRSWRRGLAIVSRRYD